MMSTKEFARALREEAERRAKELIANGDKRTEAELVLMLLASLPR